MSDRTQLTATITAVDRASPVFRQVATGADQMGKSIDQAGKTGSSSLTNLSAKAAAMGAALTAVGAVLGQWSRSSQDAAAIQRQLEAAITASGSSFADYAAQIDAAGAHAVQLGIDDEKASQAIAALTETTGSAQTALDLLGLAEDLSAAKGIDLVSAAELIGKVHEGNTAILQRYGIVVAQGATAEQALAAVQAQVAGQAEAHATTYARLREELSNVTDAIGGAVGGFAPFLQMLPAMSAGVELAGGAIGAFTTLMTASGEAAAVGAVGMEALTVAEEAEAVAAGEAAVATGLLDVALGPVGLVLAAVAAGVAIYALTKGHDDQAKAAETAAAATDKLATTIANLTAAGSPLAATATQWADSLNAGAATLSTTLAGLQQQIDQLNAQPSGGTENPVVDPEALKTANAQLAALQGQVADTTTAQTALNAVLTDTGTGANLAQARVAELFAAFEASPQSAADLKTLDDQIVWVGTHLGLYDQAANDAAAKTRALASEATGAADTIDALGKVSKDLGVSFEETAAGQKLLADIQIIHTKGTAEQIAAIQKDTDAVVAGTMAYGTYAATVHLTATMLDAGTQSLIAMRAANDEQARSLAATQQGYDANARALADFNDAQHQSLGAMRTTNDEYSRQLALKAQGTAANTRELAAYEAVNHEIDQSSDKIVTLSGGLHRAADETDQSSDKVVTLSGDFNAMGKEVGAAAASLGVFATLAQKLRPVDIGVRGGDKTTGTAAAMQGVASGMDAVLGNFKVIDDLAQRQEQAGSIAENLIGTPGEWAEIDKLVSRGEISQTRYNQAVDAGYRIEERQRSVEQNLNVIRAKQLPLLDQQDKSYAKQIANITHMSAVQQEVTLGFMDAAEAQKVQTAVTLAADAANTKAGSSARQAAQDVIEGAAVADPVFKEMAKSIGLITEDKHGHITVNFDNADSLNADIEALTASVDALTLALGGVPPDTPVKVHAEGTDEAKGKVGEVHQSLDALPPEVSSTVSVNDNASGTLANIAGLLNSLDGRSVATSVTNTTTNVTNNVTTNSANPLNLRHGGIVPWEDEARNGLVTGGMRSVLVGEAGPETVMLPGGSYVRNAAATATKGGGHQFNFTVNGGVHGFDGVDEVFAAFARAARVHFAGMGM